MKSQSQKPEDVPASSQSPAQTTLVLHCRACGKVHRVKERPRDVLGGAASHFLFTCIGCCRTEIRTSDEMTEHVADQAGNPALTPSKSP